MIILASILLLAGMPAGCGNLAWPGESTVPAGQVKMIITGYPAYPNDNLEQLVKRSATIVQGTVISRGRPFLQSLAPGSDDGLELVYTPVTIQVTATIKGKPAELVIFNELGGETETRILTPREPMLTKFDEVLLFLDNTGSSWPGQGVYIIRNDEITVNSALLGNTAPTGMDGSEQTTLAVTEFLKLVRPKIG